MRSDTGAPEDPSPDQHGDPSEAQLGRVKRAQARAAAAKAEAQRLADRAEAERAHHRSLDAVYEIADHDSDIGGSIMACALAYRLFIWLLPLALVAIPGLGLYSQEASETPERAARSIGLAGLVAGSVAEASKSSTRWYALIVGIPILVWATRSLLRALLVTHRLVWSDARGARCKADPARDRPAPGRIARLLCHLGARQLLPERGRVTAACSLPSSSSSPMARSGF